MELSLKTGLSWKSNGHYDFLYNGKFGAVEPEITDDTAARGLGEAAKVHIAPTI